MDTTTLVKRDGEIAGPIMEALSRIEMPVTLLRWNYVPQLDEWQLIIATPWYDLKGPRTTIEAAIDAFQKAGIYEDVPMRRVFFKSPNDYLVKTLEEPSSEGWLHLLRGRSPGGTEEYSASFAPLFLPSGGSIPIRRFQDVKELEHFLVGTLRISRRLTEDALEELRMVGSAHLSPVSLTVRELKRAGLA